MPEGLLERPELNLRHFACALGCAVVLGCRAVVEPRAGGILIVGGKARPLLREEGSWSALPPIGSGPDVAPDLQVFAPSLAPVLLG